MPTKAGAAFGSSALERVDLLGQPGNVTRAGLAVVEALRDGTVDTAHSLDERLLRSASITGLDSSTHTLHTRTHVGADVPIVRGSLYRLPDSLFC